MTTEITREMVQTLETVHGPGRVAVLYAGAREFSFLIPDGKKAQEILQREDDGAKDALELAARQLLLCPASPNAGKGPAGDLKLSKPELDIMMAERAALEAVINKAPIVADQLGGALLAHAGYRADITVDNDGDSYVFTTQLSDGLGGELDAKPIVMTAKRPERAVYAVWREKKSDRWEAASYIVKALCTSGNADEILTRYPFLAFSLGSQLLPGLGYEEARVGVKKFSASASQTP